MNCAEFVHKADRRAAMYISHPKARNADIPTLNSRSFLRPTRPTKALARVKQIPRAALTVIPENEPRIQSNITATAKVSDENVASRSATNPAPLRIRGSSNLCSSRNHQDQIQKVTELIGIHRKSFTVIAESKIHLCTSPLALCSSAEDRVKNNFDTYVGET